MSRICLHLCLFALLSQTSIASAGIITLASAQWEASAGGNDRWYALVEFSSGQVTWDTARHGAESLVLNGRNGHLATFSSEGEWVFARDVLLEPLRREFDQAWLGATDELTEGAFQWVTGEPFTYSSPATFDNLQNEDYVMAWRFGPTDPLQWNDVNSTTSLSNRALVEFGGEAAAVPEPSSLAVLAIASCFSTWRVSKRRRGAQRS